MSFFFRAIFSYNLFVFAFVFRDQIFTLNIDDAIEDDELKIMFSHCGMITLAKIMRDEKGLSRGFGFVCFTTPEEANKSMPELFANNFICL